jgi:hypothetical protein
VTRESALTPLALPIAVRGYVHVKQKGGHARAPAEPSDWVLIFDTETTTDPGQRLRIGYYQIRRLSKPSYCKAGFFIDPAALSQAEVVTIREYAGKKLRVFARDDFIEKVFYKYTFDFVGRCVGFNLPFDLSRLAYRHWPCKQDPYRGGFGFRLTGEQTRPTIQIRHLNNHCSFIRFTIPASRSPEQRSRERGHDNVGFRGAFIDVRTLAAALTGGSHSLKSLAKLLNTPHQKSEVDDYGATITTELLDYVQNDVQVTWECFERLQSQFESYKLTETQSHRVFGEASIGKAYLKQMGVKRWRSLQRDFPPELLGKIMSTYYGGRSEVRLRRKISRVLYCDFLSMYPTVCSLMSLWRYVIANGVRWQDATQNVRDFLETLTLDSIQDRKTWLNLTAIVKLQPEEDLFPTRARYRGDSTLSIGLNHLSSKQPLWYTLADCVASTLLTGKAPKVLEAIRFSAMEPQDGLTAVDIAGNPEYRVDPYKDDFYRRLIELRQQIKQQMKTPGIEGDKKATLDAYQQAAKITANATSYGIFVELNVGPATKPEVLTCYGINQPFETRVRAVEKPGSYFHPLLATLITGAARLMLAVAETLASRNGIGWALCDTDSFAFSKPTEMDDKVFAQRVDSIRGWFNPLSPYKRNLDLFEMEKENFPVDRPDAPAGALPLYCFAVSSKRYALANLSEGHHPIIRRLSAHGLGHLMPPTAKDLGTPEIPAPVFDLAEAGVRRWQYDVWFRILEAALRSSDEVDYKSIAGFSNKAVVRYATTTPTLLNWFAQYDRGLPSPRRIKPFNFLLMFHIDPVAWRSRADIADQDLPAGLPRVIAPFDRDPAVAAEHCFDRDTRKPISPAFLKTYSQALAQYHLHPESKFEHAEYFDRGETLRWHVHMPFVEYIGKEANRWEEQAFMGVLPEAQITYGVDPKGTLKLIDVLKEGAKTYGFASRLAREAGVNRKTADLVIKGKSRKPDLLAKLYTAYRVLEGRKREAAEHVDSVLNAVRERCRKEGGRKFARRNGLDWGDLSGVLAGRRPPGAKMLSTLETATDRII